MLEDVLPNNYVMMIKNSAHHLDLREPNPKDPMSVTVARQKETAIIKEWIEEYQNQVLP